MGTTVRRFPFPAFRGFEGVVAAVFVVDEVLFSWLAMEVAGRACCGEAVGAIVAAEDFVAEDGCAGGVFGEGWGWYACCCCCACGDADLLCVVVEVNGGLYLII